MDASRISPTPAYVVRCIAAFLEVMRGAEAMVLAGKVDVEFRETLRFASALLEIISEGAENRPDAAAYAETLRYSLRSVQGLVVSESLN